MSSFRPHSQAASLAAPHFAPVPAVRRRPAHAAGDVALVHAAVSEVGPVRAHNEDRWQSVAQAGLFVVADGMGGYNAGEIAAEIAVQTACQLIPQSLPVQSLPECLPQVVVEGALRRAHDACNAQIREYAADNPDCLGMGTTLVSCLIRDSRLHVAHVGDSRAYLLRDGLLLRLTRDHSVGQELLDSGKLTPAQLRNVPGRGILTRALGVEASVPSDCSACDWRAADTLLICTDGIADLMDDERIRQLLIASAAGGPCGQARALVAAALQAGGCDNATALVVRNAANAGSQVESTAASTAESKAQEQERARQERARQGRSIAMRNQGMN